jgi:hypothetical protein
MRSLVIAASCHRSRVRAAALEKAVQSVDVDVDVGDRER